MKKKQKWVKRTAVQNPLLPIAKQYMKSAEYLTPLIKKDNIPPSEAAVLIAMYTDAMIAGATKDHKMTEEEIIGTTNILLLLWKQELFKPNADYPYTLEETLADNADDEVRS